MSEKEKIYVIINGENIDVDFKVKENIVYSKNMTATACWPKEFLYIERVKNESFNC